MTTILDGIPREKLIEMLADYQKQVASGIGLLIAAAVVGFDADQKTVTLRLARMPSVAIGQMWFVLPEEA